MISVHVADHDAKAIPFSWFFNSFNAEGGQKGDQAVAVMHCSYLSLLSISLLPIYQPFSLSTFLFLSTIKGGSRRAEKSRKVLMMMKAVKLGWAGAGAGKKQGWTKSRARKGRSWAGQEQGRIGNWAGAG